MAGTPRIVNVGKSHLVYEGEEYVVKNGRVLKHVPDKSSAARKNKDVERVVAAYSEILHNDLSLSHHQEMMDKAEVKQRLAAAAAKGKKLTELNLRQAAKGEAILKTEFHDLDSDTPPANPLLRTRSLEWHRLFIILSPLALYGHALSLWESVGRDTSGWLLSVDNQPLITSIVMLVYVATLAFMFYWLVSVTREIKNRPEITLNFPSLGPFLLIPGVFVLSLAVTVLPVVSSLISFVVLAMWVLWAGRFVQNVNRLIGKSRAGFGMGLLFVLVPPLSHIAIAYFQRRLNILDKNKMSFLVA